MDRTQFITATAIILFAAFVAGWFCSWLVHRLTRAGAAELGELERLSQALHDAEAERDRAISTLETGEAELTRRIGELESRRQQALESLREAQTEIEELRDYIERRSPAPGR